jgi:hypothetical protein
MDDLSQRLAERAEECAQRAQINAERREQAHRNQLAYNAGRKFVEFTWPPKTELPFNAWAQLAIDWFSNVQAAGQIANFNSVRDRFAAGSRCVDFPDEQRDARRLGLGLAADLMAAVQDGGSARKAAEVLRSAYLANLGPYMVAELVEAVDYVPHPEWQFWFEKQAQGSADPVSVKLAASGPAAPRSQTNGNLRSWTQPDLDKAIEGFKAERSSSYHEAVNRIGTATGDAKKRAIRAAQKLFGRNVIAGHFQCKSKPMVGKSTVWRAMAEALELPRPTGTGRTNRGLSIVEAEAVAGQNLTSDDVDRREAIERARAKLPTSEAGPIIEELERGGCPENANRIIDTLLS